MNVTKGPFTDVRTRLLPRRLRSVFPGPEYIPSSIRTTSPFSAASMAAWIVAYWEGTSRVAAWANGAEQIKAVALALSVLHTEDRKADGMEQPR
jgi:hypothetical protein